MEGLKVLWRTKVIDASTFQEMARELQQSRELAHVAVAQEQPAANAASDDEDEGREDEQLVGEDGTPYKEPSGSPRLSSSSGRSEQGYGHDPAGALDELVCDSDDDGSLQLSPSPQRSPHPPPRCRASQAAPAARHPPWPARR